MALRNTVEEHSGISDETGWLVSACCSQLELLSGNAASGPHMSAVDALRSVDALQPAAFRTGPVHGYPVSTILMYATR